MRSPLPLQKSHLILMPQSSFKQTVCQAFNSKISSGRALWRPCVEDGHVNSSPLDLISVIYPLSIRQSCSSACRLHPVVRYKQSLIPPRASAASISPSRFDFRWLSKAPELPVKHDEVREAASILAMAVLCFSPAGKLMRIQCFFAVR